MKYTTSLYSICILRRLSKTILLKQSWKRSKSSMLLPRYFGLLSSNCLWSVKSEGYEDAGSILDGNIRKSRFYVPLKYMCTIYALALLCS